MTQPKSVDINIVLDRSGSMTTIADDTIGGYNHFLAEQRALPGQATVSLYQFDHAYDIVYAGRDIRHVPELTGATFQPRGQTALLDAIGRTINAISERKPQASVVVVIITDGHENASREFSALTIKTLIEAKRAAGWEFVFLGANQDAIVAARDYGIAPQSAMTVTANALGTQSMYGSASEKMSALRSGGSSTMSFDDGDRKKQEDAAKA